MEEKKKKNYVIPVIGALIAVVACVAYIGYEVCVTTATA